VLTHGRLLASYRGALAAPAEMCSAPSQQAMPRSAAGTLCLAVWLSLCLPPFVWPWQHTVAFWLPLASLMAALTWSESRAQAQHSQQAAKRSSAANAGADVSKAKRQASGTTLKVDPMPAWPHGQQRTTSPLKISSARTAQPIPAESYDLETYADMLALERLRSLGAEDADLPHELLRFTQQTELTAQHLSVFCQRVEDCVPRCPMLQLPLSARERSILRPACVRGCDCLVAHGTAALCVRLHYCLLCLRMLPSTDTTEGSAGSSMVSSIGSEPLATACRGLLLKPACGPQDLSLCNGSRRPGLARLTVPAAEGMIATQAATLPDASTEVGPYASLGASRALRMQGTLKVLNTLCMQQHAAQESSGSLVCIHRVQWGAFVAHVSYPRAEQSLQQYAKPNGCPACEQSRWRSARCMHVACCNRTSVRTR
jgi:hypothetical protein